MSLLAQLVIYLLALSGVVLGALGVLFFTGGALNRARSRAYRIRRAVLAAASLCGIFASAALGFVGIAWVMYLAQAS